MTEDILTADLLLCAYANGYFPMAENRNASELRWFTPQKRGIIPLDNFHIPRSLEKLMRKKPFTLTVDTAFPDVINACAQRPETWINDEIIRLYCELWQRGYAHSVECWKDDTLAGGIYGIALGGAFFGESMFSHTPNASKVALVHLLRTLHKAGYTLFDTQYVNPHLLQFGTIEIPRKKYLEKLEAALNNNQAWPTTLE